LAKSNLKLVLADESVPAGNYARQILTKISDDPAYGSDFNAKVLANIVSNEMDVKQVVTKVELGEADAGIVYISDVVAAPDLATITIPDNFNVTANYPIAILTNAPQPKLAEAFIAYIISPDGWFSRLGVYPTEPGADQSDWFTHFGINLAGGQL
jgi:molybdate transport system substrate-binding protein